MERKLTIISQPENYTNQLSRKILEDNRDKLDAMADALMKYETIDVHQIDDIMEGKSPRPPKGWSGNGGSGPGPAGDQKSEGESPVNEKPPEDSADDTLKEVQVLFSIKKGVAVIVTPFLLPALSCFIHV